ncbi:anaerobic ribonucleoside triphosphate reductase [Tepiditoga spiralis]|uniref:Anaerobic ribonucleoside triphosphate reductase n=1 Tax=Tepiditoga spiralis TaxID=2108365 RepID=A0A7G1G585_9BACT|nr:anaerobic ribonucleoside-triphosphate reductase [Tepiditoga spiralis]BBE31730.1 anaerobic ribonucleoside triphosphate reductase [Tepiditoga spiralis]
MSKRNLANTKDNSINLILEKSIDYQKNYILKSIIPLNLSKNHKNKNFWIHDLEYYDISHNCIGLNIKTLIKKDNKNISFEKALKLLYKKIVEITNIQSGGIGIINFDTDMAYYLKNETKKEISYHINDFFNKLNLPIRKGCEKPYVTLNFGLDTSEKGRLISNVLLEEFEKGNDENEPYIFPNLVFKIKNGINYNEKDINYDLLIRALKTTSKCMIPTYMNCDSQINKRVDSKEIGIMGCRSRIVNNIFGKSTSINRGNIASVTINLIKLAINSNNNKILFYKELNNLMEESKELLIHRLNKVSNSNMNEYFSNNKIYIDYDKDYYNMLKNGTLSIGFIGLWESLAILKNEKIKTINFIENNYNEAIQIIKFMHNKINQFTNKNKLNFSLLATSGEGISGIFPESDKKIKNLSTLQKSIITKGYYNNSFHIPVELHTKISNKIKYEGNFHKYCTGGSISYVELKEIPTNNIEALKEIIQLFYINDCNYFGINFPLDKCKDCNYINKIDKSCPKCGSTNIIKLRRVSGYLSEENKFASGKKKELKNRKNHSL